MLRKIMGITGISLFVTLTIAIVLFQVKSKPKELQKILDESPLEVRARDFVELLVKGNYEQAVRNFDGTMKRALPAKNLQQVWESLIAQSGAFEEQLEVRKEKVFKYDVIFVSCRFEKAVLDAKVVYNSEKKVSGLFFVPSQSN